MSDNFQLYLASQSPRRRQLLQQIDISVRCIVIDTDETLVTNESATAAVRRLAMAKAVQGWQHPEREFDKPVLGADTLVVCDDIIMGKPQDQQQALTMLRQLSGRSHQVMTAVACCQGEKLAVRCSTSVVSFAEITPIQAQRYWLSGEPKDKAGAYAIQGYAGLWIKEIVGSYSGIMGLPLFETGELLREFAVLD